MRLAVLVALSLAVTFESLAGYPTATGGPPGTAPDFQIMEPAAAALVSTLGFRVVVSLTNFILDLENYGREAIPGHGHMHYYVDGVLAGTAWTESFSVGPFASGPHLLEVALRNNDHTPLDPDISRSVSISAVTPSIEVVVSADSVREGEPLVVSWTVTGFVLDGSAIGGDPEPGRGHVRVEIDRMFLEGTAASSITMTDLPRGNHTILVSLRNNDRSSLSPEAAATVAVEVTAGDQGTRASFGAETWVLATIALALIGVTTFVLWRKRRRAAR